MKLALALIPLLLGGTSVPIIEGKANNATTQTATTYSPNYYVATTGADTNTCTSVGQECLTIQGALDKIPKAVNYPVTVNVAAGTTRATSSRASPSTRSLT